MGRADSVSCLSCVKATFFYFGGKGIKEDMWMYRPLQALISYDSPSIATKSVFLLGRRCLRDALGWGKESTNAYWSLFIKLKYPTYSGTTSISFLFPHCLPYIVSFCCRIWKAMDSEDCCQSGGNWNLFQAHVQLVSYPCKQEKPRCEL